MILRGLPIWVGAVLFIVLANAKGAQQQPAVRGVLDLRQWDFAQNPKLNLYGEWEFYWNRLLEPGDDFSGEKFLEIPKAWNRHPDSLGNTLPAMGYGTYRLTVLLPAEHLDMHLDIPPQNSAFRVWANGKYQGEMGKVGTSKEKSEARLGHLRFDEDSWGDSLVLVVQISNWSHFRGGLWKPAILGTAEYMQRSHFLNHSLRLWGLGGLVMVMIYHLVIFFYRRRDFVQIIFCSIAFIAVVRLVIPGDHLLRDWFPWISFDVAIRIGYVALGWTLATLFLFARYFYPREIPRLATQILLISGALYSLWSIIAPLPLLTMSQGYVQIVHAIFAPILVLGTFLAAYRRRPGALTLFLSMSLLFLSTLNDTLQARQIVQTGYWSSYVLILVVFSQWLFLVQRYSLAHVQVERQLEDFIKSLANAIESKDFNTVGHVERIANYARDLASAQGLTTHEVNQIYLGAMVHDVGKISVPDSILNKPGKLSEEELRMVRNHAAKGFELLKGISGTDIISKIALHHHERWNGMGYPRALAGKEIPLEARIVAIADYWDAITSDRPFRAAMHPDQALETLRSERSKTLDPQLLDLFIETGIWRRHLHRARKNPLS